MNTLIYIFIIAAIGYLLGRVSIKGIQLGTAVIFIVALVFGHFGIIVDSIVKNIGLVLFVGSVGLIAGPVFFSNFKKKASSYIVLGVLIITFGCVLTYITAKLFNVPGHLAVGIFNGALTSTPGLAAATDISTDPSIPIGYGVAYLFGVIGVVLFIQILPKILGKNMVEEAEEFKNNLKKKEENKSEDDKKNNFKIIEPTGLFVIALTVALGILLGNVKVPLPGGGSFALGSTGGPLFVGIILGHMRHVGNISIEVPKQMLKILRELGLVLFLIGAGTEAGQGFLSTVSEYGVALFFQGVIITIVPMILATIVALKIFKMDLINSLGSICGGMTSTPALGSLISSAKTDEVTIAYASTYPIALILVVFATQILMYVL
ncbi:MAG: permease [Suipraeoptans sp.]